MGMKLGQYKSSKPTMVITVTPRGTMRNQPLSSSSSIFSLDLPTTPTNNSNIRPLSQNSLMSVGSYSGFKEKECIGFDLLAEVSCEVPCLMLTGEQPMAPKPMEVWRRPWDSISVESDKEMEEDDVVIAEFCDGFSLSDSDDKSAWTLQHIGKHEMGEMGSCISCDEACWIDREGKVGRREGCGVL